MLNLFLMSTVYGKATAMAYNINGEGSIKSRNLLDVAISEHSTAGKMTDAELGQFVRKHGRKALNKIWGDKQSTMRVSALSCLVDCFTELDTEDLKEPLTCYVPKALLEEIQSGRHKYYMCAEEDESTAYYSEAELKLWESFYDLTADITRLLIFKDVYSCNLEETHSQAQEERLAIYEYMVDKRIKPSVEADRPADEEDDEVEVEVDGPSVKRPKASGNSRYANRGSRYATK